MWFHLQIAKISESFEQQVWSFQNCNMTGISSACHGLHVELYGFVLILVGERVGGKMRKGVGRKREERKKNEKRGWFDCV